MTAVEQPRDDLDHFSDMLGRPGRNLGPLVAECVKIFPKILDKGRGKFVDAYILFGSLIDNPVIDIGQIKDVRQIVAFEFEISP